MFPNRFQLVAVFQSLRWFDFKLNFFIIQEFLIIIKLFIERVTILQFTVEIIIRWYIELVEVLFIELVGSIKLLVWKVSFHLTGFVSS